MVQQVFLVLMLGLFTSGYTFNSPSCNISDSLEQGYTSSTKRDNQCKMSNQSNTPLANEHLSIKISTETTVVRKSKPFVLTLRVENLAGEALDLTRYASIMLEGTNQSQEERRRFGQNFSGSLPFTSNLPPDFKYKTSLQPKESLEIQVDIKKLMWEQSFLSAYHPVAFSKVVPGGYYVMYVQVRMDDKEKGEGFTKTFKSNEVYISIEGK